MLILTQPHPQLWKRFRWDFWPLIAWTQSPETLRCLLLCDLHNQCPITCLLSSTGLELISTPLLAWPMLDLSPLTRVCLNRFVSRMPCPGSPSHHNCCIVLSSSSCSTWQSVQRSHAQKSFFSCIPSWNHALLPMPLNLSVRFVSVLRSHGSSWAFSSTLWSSLPGWSFPLWKSFNTSLTDHWGPSRWNGSLSLLPLLLFALWPIPVLWSRNCPSPEKPRAAIEQAVPPKSPLSASPYSEIYLAKASKPLLYLPHSHVSSARGLLHLESLPDGTIHGFVSPWCLLLPSHMHPSAPCGSSSHHCLPHWLVVRVHWVAPLSQVLICRVISSSSSPIISCSRLKSPTPFLCRSAASLSVDQKMNC